MSRPATAAVRLLTGEREPVRLATTQDITLSGLQTIDGVLAEVGDRILVKDQTDARQNGIYTASEGAWFRASDARESAAINKGVTVHVQQGTIASSHVYAFQTLDPKVGTDNINLTFFLSDNVIGDLNDAVDEAIEQISQTADAFAGELGSIENAVELAETAADEAEASEQAAAGYAALAMSNWVVDTFIGDGTSDPLELTVTPGSINNCVITVEGEGPQPRHIFSLAGILLSPPPATVWPLGKTIEVAYGTSISVNTPADNSVTRTKLADDSVGPDELDEETVNADHIDGADAADIRTKIGLGSGASPAFAGLSVDGVSLKRTTFSAHKNGTAQTGILPDTATKITFGTEAWDIGTFYDAAQSRWVPPAGKYRLNAALYWSGTVDGSEYTVELWKNGAMVKAAYFRAPTTGAGVHAIGSWLIEVDGDDYLEIYGRGSGAGNKSVNGTVAYNYFEGEAI